MANMEGFRDDTKSRSLEYDTNDLTADDNSNKTQKKSLSGPPNPMTEAPIGATDAGAVETDDNDVFYDARSEDSGGGILPSNTSDISKMVSALLLVAEFWNRVM